MDCIECLDRLSHSIRDNCFDDNDRRSQFQLGTDDLCTNFHLSYMQTVYSNMQYTTKDFPTAKLNTITNIFSLKPSRPLSSFGEMCYHIFLWALFSSIFVHVIAAAIAFATLRKHRFGKFFPIFILLMGTLGPITSGVVSSAAIAFVYCTSGLPMAPLYALFWGVGQTVMIACFGFTRILATL